MIKFVPSHFVNHGGLLLQPGVSYEMEDKDAEELARYGTVTEVKAETKATAKTGAKKKKTAENDDILG